MKILDIALLCAVMVIATITTPPTVSAQAAGINRDTGRNAGEVRPGNADGNSPSASAGTIVAKPARRIFGVPVMSVLLITAVIAAILTFALPSVRRRTRARSPR